MIISALSQLSICIVVSLLIYRYFKYRGIPPKVSPLSPYGFLSVTLFPLPPIIPLQITPADAQIHALIHALIHI